MPTASVIRVAVFAAGAALGAAAATLAQRRNDRLVVPVTAPLSTTATPRNNEISRMPVVQVGPGGELLARFQGVSSDVLKYGNPGKSLYSFICQGRTFVPD